ncbi:MAG: DegV family protein [Clostridiales bacterium]|nr:DegV family protein [Clostridiales bacterium]
MNDYIIIADSACDLGNDIPGKLKVKIIDMKFSFENSPEEHTNYSMPCKDFYKAMRAGSVSKTTAVNVSEYVSAFEEELIKGNDILYICFSSGLSMQHHFSKVAAKELIEKYPERKIEIVDSLCASGGYGLLVTLAAKKRDEGVSIDELKTYVLEKRLNICHWFTVDNLEYLRRGGRLSAGTALIGGILGIKPVLHTDDNGKLVNVYKVRGRKASLSLIADKYGELSVNPPKEDIVYLCHADCPEDAKTVKHMLYDRYGVKVKLITDISPIIGSHSGPGTLALFFEGKHR